MRAVGHPRLFQEAFDQLLEDSGMRSIDTNGLPAAEDRDAQVLAAIELSQKRWRVAGLVPAVDKISLVDLTGGDAAGVLERLRRWQQEAVRRLGRPVQVSVCYEAGRDGFWLARFLEARGVEILVLDPASLQVNRRARRAKTDRLDAEALLRALRRHKWGEPKVFSIVRPPTPADEDSRCLSREREALIKERTRATNSIKALLTAQGVTGIPVGQRGWTNHLVEARTGDGRPLGEHLRQRLQRTARRLDELNRQIAEVEAELDALDRRRSASLPKGGTTIAARLQQLVSIGTVTAVVLEEEAFHRQFANRRHVGAYSGLTPTPFQSGDSSREQGIAKAGNRRLRRSMIELAWRWVYQQPDNPLSKWFHARVGNARGRVRRVAIVAVARKLLIALWRYATTGEIPEGARLSAA